MLTITDLCKAGLTSYRGIRWWEERGLLGKVDKSAKSWKITEEHLRRVKIISAAQYCSFSLEEIASLIDNYDIEAHEALQVKLSGVAHTALSLSTSLPEPLQVFDL